MHLAERGETFLQGWLACYRRVAAPGRDTPPMAPTSPSSCVNIECAIYLLLAIRDL